MLRAVSGHRDTGSTECPGNALYARLGAIAAVGACARRSRRSSSRRRRRRDSSIRFRARVSQSQPWDGRRHDRSAAPRSRGGTGTGTRRRLDVGLGGRPAGLVQVDDRRRLRPAGDRHPPRGRRHGCRSRSRAPPHEPEAISPNGDGQADAATLTYRISAAGERHRRGDRRARRSRSRPWSTACGRRPASTR